MFINNVAMATERSLHINLVRDKKDVRLTMLNGDYSVSGSPCKILKVIALVTARAFIIATRLP